MLSMSILIAKVTIEVRIVVLNCQNCDQCLNGHKSLGSLFEVGLLLSLSYFFFFFVIAFLLVMSSLLTTLIKCLKGHKSLGILPECVLNNAAVFVIVFLLILQII